jgi:hypothetical protein
MSPEQVGELAELFIRADPERAAGLVEQIDNQVLRNRLREAIATSNHAAVSLQSREAMCNLMLADEGRSEHTIAAFETLVQEMATVDPTRGVSVVLSLGDPELKVRAAASFTAAWAALSPAEASEWVVTLSPGRVRDAAARELALACKDSPEVALANAAAIADLPLRAATVDAIVSLWQGIDQARLQRAVNAAGL